MLHHSRELDTVGVQLRHGDLVVLRRVALGHRRNLDQLLLACEHLLEERGRDHVVRRHVVLQLLREVGVEGALAGKGTHEVVHRDLPLDLLDLSSVGHLF